MISKCNTYIEAALKDQVLQETIMYYIFIYSEFRGVKWKLY